MRVELCDKAIVAASGRKGFVTIAIELPAGAPSAKAYGAQAEMDAGELVGFFLALRGAIVEAGLDEMLRETLRAQRDRELEIAREYEPAEG